MRYSIYKIWKCSGFATLVFDENVANNKPIYYDGKPKGMVWHPPAVYIPRPENAQWDIFTIYGPSALVLTKHGLQSLAGYFLQEGYELLPLSYQGIDYTVVNVLEINDCLQHEGLQRSATGSIEQYSFIPEKLTRSLFKIPEEVYGSMFVAEDSHRPKWSFKYHVELHKLRGIKFKLIWEGD